MKKRGLLFIGGGLVSLVLCLVLLFNTDSLFSTLFFYLSLVLNIIGLYILIWKRNGGKKNGTE